MEKALILVGESLLKCDKGSSTSVLNVSSQQFATVNGHLKATEKDCKPNENIFPFGVCSLTQKPCTLGLLEWQNKIESQRVNGMAILTEKSVLPCALGGVITPEMVAQQFYYVGVFQQKQYVKNGNDLGIVDAYFTDEKGERIEATEPNKTVFLNLETENMIGKRLNIDLSNDTIDFLYNGNRLENDRIKNIIIYENKTVIELKTIKQKEEV